MQENAETRAIKDTCSALCLPNQERAYEVACALKFAEEKAGTDGIKMASSAFVFPVNFLSKEGKK
jgi:hypothetical protein